jgi:putative ABC transport system substrate-binding protein
MIRGLPAFRQALAARGYIEGRNLKVEYRFADGMVDRLPALAGDLVRSGVVPVVTVGLGASATRAVRGESTTIPFVFGTGVDPIRAGLVPNLNRPGNNTTGAMAMQTHYAFSCTNCCQAQHQSSGSNPQLRQMPR